jgi:nicotinamidase-related amidase
MRIQRNDTVALLIDLQYRLFPHIYEFEQLELNTVRLLEGLKVLNIPLIVTEQYTKGLGQTLPSIQEVLMEKYQPIEKMAFSCCDSEAFMDKLKSQGKKNVVLFGIESHVCVLQTSIDLIEQGFRPVVVEDCVSSRKLSDKTTAIERMHYEGAIITSYESILLELCRTSGTDEFRSVSKIIK